jgi:SAM-dependent methyltransferase
MDFEMIETSHYTDDFYKSQQAGSYSSAKAVLPIVQEVFHPKSVIDVGCGVGYWLKVWHEDLQVPKIQGVEGPYVSPEMLQIKKENVLFQDLKTPLNILERFDLAMSLEVAEHLPAESAVFFIQTLTSLSDVILFSAAIEGQEGTYHINEQMPEYWSRIFQQFGYVPVDYIRPKIWGNNEVEWWYQQNILLYIKESVLHNFPQLEEAYKNTNPNSLLRIHPWIFWYKNMHIKKISSWEGFIRWKLYPLKKAVLKLIKK